MKLSPEKLADYIVEWLETRNGAQLREAIEAMPVGDFRLMREELALILEHQGHPPNWVAPAASPQGKDTTP